MPVKTMLK